MEEAFLNHVTCTMMPLHQLSHMSPCTALLSEPVGALQDGAATAVLVQGPVVRRLAADIRSVDRRGVGLCVSSEPDRPVRDRAARAAAAPAPASSHIGWGPCCRKLPGLLVGRPVEKRLVRSPIAGERSLISGSQRDSP